MLRDLSAMVSYTYTKGEDSMKHKEDNVNKANAYNVRAEIQSDLEANMDKFNDPVVLGELLYKLLEERENTNRILKNILSKLENIEGKAQPEIQAQVKAMDAPILPEIDERILKFVHEKGKASAEDVRKAFKYKGKNAASARLNKLYELGLLEKRQVGKKVFFFAK